MLGCFIVGDTLLDQRREMINAYLCRDIGASDNFLNGGPAVPAPAASDIQANWYDPRA